LCAILDEMADVLARKFDFNARQIAANLSPSVSYDQDYPRRMLHFRDSNGVPPEQFFNARCLVIAVFESDELGRRASFFSKSQEVGVSGYDWRIRVLRHIPRWSHPA